MLDTNEKVNKIYQYATNFKSNYEYLVIKNMHNSDLNNLGEQGWMLTAIDGENNYIFVRLRYNKMDVIIKEKDGK